MKKYIQILIGEMGGKLGGYSALLNYRFMNLCVKAEPVALIPVVVNSEDNEELSIEDVAFVLPKNDYQFEIIPKDIKQIFTICKGIREAHPEFKQEVVAAEDDTRLYNVTEEEQHIICTVPEVNKDRHDFLLDAIKVLYDQCKVQMEKVNAEYAAKLAPKLVGLPEEAIEEAKAGLEDTQQMYAKIRDEYLTNKQKEIEDAYQHYLEKIAANEAAEKERKAATGEGVGQGFHMGDYEE